MTLQELREQKGDKIRAIAAKHGVTAIRVFRSFARGEAGPDSDLDLLIESGPGRTPFFPGGLVVDLEEAVGLRVDLTTLAALHPILRERVLREAVPF
jgi:predicted nucleotidyltransferase